MGRITLTATSAAALFITGIAVGALMKPMQNAVAAEQETAARPARVLVEIYRIAPGKHKAFLRDIASYDKANQVAGLPPRQLYVHSDGANWDFMLIQPAKTPADRAAALDAAWDELNLPSGFEFFSTFRENITEHSDTFAYGPTSAGAVLSSVKE